MEGDLMGECNIDHSKADVAKKLASQKAHLPANLRVQLLDFLDGDRSQETLNDLFHLLKKYDLATKSEQEDRNERLKTFK
ncbi:hypothetical protein WMZ97_08410 [Lentibacillus sp. N15]|uniref:hypothetical protein n=1 Tax=Lentibacillus songyuanensis TaxID=3136161 RepID=UPI0031BB8779